MTWKTGRVSPLEVTSAYAEVTGFGKVWGRDCTLVRLVSAS